MSVNTDSDFNAIHELFKLIVEHDMERNHEIHRYVLAVAACTSLAFQLGAFRFCEKYRPAETREEGPFDHIIGAIVEETIAMFRQLCDKLARKSAKLADVMSLTDVDHRLKAITSYGAAKGAQVATVSTIDDCHTGRRLHDGGTMQAPSQVFLRAASPLPG